MQLQPGTLLLNGKFRIVRRLGGGSSAEVYEATQLGLNAPRALKILNLDGVSSTEVTKYAARFDFEGRLQARLKGHPRIVEVYDTDILDGAPVLIMEYCEGGSLQDELGAVAKLRQAIDASRVSEVLLDIADGLVALHRLNCVHRDLKPSNLLLDSARRAKIGDLGLAQAEDAPDIDRSDEQANAHPGTPPYMSPEHAFRKAYLTPAADIYALGVIGYRMLTGRFPEGPNPSRRPKDGRPGVPDWLDALVMGMLAFDPRERPQDGGVVAAALRAGMTADADRAAQASVIMKRQAISRRVALFGAGGLGAMGLAWLATQVVGGALQSTLTPTPTRIPPTLTPEPTNTRLQSTVAPTGTFPSATTSPTPTPTSTPVIAFQQISADRGLLTLTLGVRMEFVRVPAGEFWMGSDKSKDGADNSFEVPRHPLNLNQYWIGKTEVTVAQFEAYAKATGVKTTASSDLAKKSNHPVVDVTWDDCIAFCRWASKLGGGEVTLPSEAEWEKAARGTDARLYPWGPEAPDNTRLNSSSSGISTTTPVGRYGAKGESPYGCDDMAGNVWEWTRSLLKGYKYEPNDGREDLTSRDSRVLRGGAFNLSALFARCAYRHREFPDGHGVSIGFRVAFRPASL